MSPDLRTRYWISQRSGRACVRVGDEPDTCYDGVAVGHVAFSLDGAHRAFPARLGDGWHVVRDGRPGPRYDGIGELAFSPDGRRLAYAAQRDGSWRVVLDGREGPSFDSLYAGSLLFEPTGRRLAYAGVLHGWAHVVVDGARSEPHEAVSQIRFSSDGSRVGYLARDPPGVRLVVEGRTGPAENAIDTYRFGPGERVAYVALARGVWWVVVGDRRMGPYRSVSGLTLRPDDGEPAFVEADSARNGSCSGGEPRGGMRRWIRPCSVREARAGVTSVATAWSHRS